MTKVHALALRRFDDEMQVSLHTTEAEARKMLADDARTHIEHLIDEDYVDDLDELCTDHNVGFVTDASDLDDEDAITIANDQDHATFEYVIQEVELP